MRAIWRPLTAAIALALVINLLSFTLPLSAGHASWDQKTTPYATTAPAPTLTLDQISTNGSVLLDSSGRTVVLRGFRTITHNTDCSAVDYAIEDYERMKSLGANYQSIRVFAPSVGGWPGETVSPYYMDRLDSMTSLAKQVGLYTVFKLTMFGLPDFDWTDLWLNENGEQDAVIAGWKNIWERYKDETAVIGYDLIGEPQKGDLSVGDEEFVSDYLTPFYQKAIDELRKIDDKHLVLFEPALGGYDSGFLPYNVPISREQVVYAPHFYPYILYPYWIGNYASTFDRYANEARMHNAPLLIGEYGVPWSHLDDGNIIKENEYQVTEKAALELFDSAAVGFSRPWYADDRARVTDMLNWALIKGTSGLGGELRTFIIDVLSRPYPRRTAGSLGSFGYDTDTRRFAMSYMPDSGLGETCIFVPLERQYSGAFTVTHSSGITLSFDSSTCTLTVVSNPGDIDPARFRWDETDQTLRISEWQDAVTVTVEIEP